MNRTITKDWESSVEYSLADYMGDIKKLLFYTARIVPESRYLNESDMSFAGKVEYTIVYSDSDGEISKLEINSDYDVSIPVTGGEYTDAVDDTRIANLSIRLTGPRKLIAKATALTSVNMLGEDRMEYAGDGLDEDREVYKAEKTIERESISFSDTQEKEYVTVAETVEDINPEDIEILGISGQIRVIDSETVEGGIKLKGEIILTIIIRKADMEPYPLKKVLPFEEIIKTENIIPGENNIADGEVSSVDVSVKPKGEGAELEVKAKCVFKGAVIKNEEVKVIEDAYLKDYESMQSYEDYDYNSLVECGIKDISYNFKKRLQELDIENISSVLHTFSEAKILDKKMNGSVMEIEGEVTFSGVACQINDDESISYMPIKFTEPFKISVNGSAFIPENAKLWCKITIPDNQSGFDSEYFYLNCNMKLCYHIFLNNSVRKLKECAVSGDMLKSTGLSTITVYFPQPGETLFEVAKKFKSTEKRIVSDNSLALESSQGTEGGVLNGVKKLIIR